MAPKTLLYPRFIVPAILFPSFYGLKFNGKIRRTSMRSVALLQIRPFLDRARLRWLCPGS